MNIKERLKKILADKALSITDAAAQCDIPYRSLQNYLRGEREPNAEALISIGTHLGINIDWLLTGRGGMHLSEHADVLTEQPEYSHADLKLLEFLNQLEPDIRKDLLRSAEEKQRVAALEKRLEELALELESLKRSA
ncbi:helix-turn-helix domain-containing protein [Escherichia coli]|uniref:helix-turn-helix domain-containing protein n=1 Tax=Escherichia coli TaxID=562 RepID=UPI00069B6B29|nr:helix-turn-helix transcriptional regulator [Escherichia coli]EFH3410623.1 helix-turn-helix domain-containing protein [Escherichia coli]EFH3509604.1 helix-turn-helix domain-containing protein [Escherichia coli]EGH1358776.1 helix-turn-helix transcriptional regulator [Escherichia coli]EGM8545141.1 helix-turn-helix transcriptional regulator [Escherichia coli]EJR8421236.1 helix-turn-helix transcriptional regulator [Escherichia coli]